MSDLSTPRDECVICVSAVSSGIGAYPWTCANGHTLYRGGGACMDFERRRIVVPPWCYEPLADGED